MQESREDPFRRRSQQDLHVAQCLVARLDLRSQSPGGRSPISIGKELVCSVFQNLAGPWHAHVVMFLIDRKVAFDWKYLVARSLLSTAALQCRNYRVSDAPTVTNEVNIT